MLPYLQDRPYDLFGTGIEVVAAYDCFDSGDDYGMEYPGFQGMDLGYGTGKWRRAKPDPYIFHFPDGNASIARMLVRSLVPGSIPGSSMEDIVLAPCDYAKLDDPTNQVRIRLELDDGESRAPRRPRSREEESRSPTSGAITSRRSAQARASWPAGTSSHVSSRRSCRRRRKNNLAYCVKEPYVYTHVALTNWRSFNKLGAKQILAPGSYHYFTMLDYPVDMGGYAVAQESRTNRSMLFMLRAPTKYGLPPKEQYRAGRWELFTRRLRQSSATSVCSSPTMLAGAGFDPAREIAGITVNRWSHGYAYEYDKSLWEHWPEGQRPCDLAKKPYGRIAIANSDSSGAAFTDTAIDEGHRAVRDVLQAS